MTTSISPRTTDITPPLDYSFRCITAMIDVPDEDPREGAHKLVRDPESGKAVTTSLRLNNNAIQDLNGFADIVSDKVLKPEELSWIDLSFNDLSVIDKVLLDYMEVKMLYLHGNHINKLSEIDKLAALPKLISLTLHGNPVENEKGYRHYVLSRIPQLRTLNFSAVTKEDRATALTLGSRVGKRNRQRKKTTE